MGPKFKLAQPWAHPPCSLHVCLQVTLSAARRHSPQCIPLTVRAVHVKISQATRRGQCGTPDCPPTSSCSDHKLQHRPHLSFSFTSHVGALSLPFALLNRSRIHPLLPSSSSATQGLPPSLSSRWLQEPRSECPGLSHPPAKIPHRASGDSATWPNAAQHPLPPPGEQSLTPRLGLAESPVSSPAPRLTLHPSHTVPGPPKASSRFRTRHFGSLCLRHPPPPSAVQSQGAPRSPSPSLVPTDPRSGIFCRCVFPIPSISQAGFHRHLFLHPFRRTRAPLGRAVLPLRLGLLCSVCTNTWCSVHSKQSTDAPRTRVWLLHSHCAPQAGASPQASGPAGTFTATQAARPLCDPRQATLPLWGSVSPSEAPFTTW